MNGRLKDWMLEEHPIPSVHGVPRLITIILSRMWCLSRPAAAHRFYIFHHPTSFSVRIRKYKM